MTSKQTRRLRNGFPIFGLHREVTAIGILRQDLTQFRQLNTFEPVSGRSAFNSRIFDRLCESYENLAIPGGESGCASVAMESDYENSLCSSIDELLDQVACLPVNSRLWSVKALLICEQIADFASRRQIRLEMLLRADAPRSSNKAVKQANRPTVYSRASA